MNLVSMFRWKKRGFKHVIDEARVGAEAPLLPRRSTKHSAGYDFYSPRAYIVKPGEKVEIPLNIKAYMQVDEVLLIFPRSSMGIKHKFMLENTVPVIDADFYGNPDNDGNISLHYKNTGTKEHVIYRGDKIAQGVFMKFLLTDDDWSHTKGERIGGTGSTGK